MNKVALRHDQWLDEMHKRYGPKARDAKFVCPACGHVQTAEQFLQLGMSPPMVASVLGYSCIGRYLQGVEVRDAFGQGPGPCNYAGGGLLQISPILVTIDNREFPVFDFADDPLAAKEVVARD